MTLSANDIPELAGQDFGTIVWSDGGILVERSMFWRPVGTPPGTPWVGGHTALGSMGLSKRWFFAEGAAAPGFETFYLVFNPTATTLVLEANFFTEAQGLVQRVYQRPTRRTPGDLCQRRAREHRRHGRVPLRHHPFIAERSIYWGQGRVEGTSTIGETNAAWRWDLPEGVAGSNFDTFLLLANPFDSASTVDLSMQIEGYGQITLPPSMRKVVPAYGRLTLYMPRGAARRRRSPKACRRAPWRTCRSGPPSASSPGPPIVAEHAIYWQRAGSNFWRAGSAAFGTPR